MELGYQMKPGPLGVVEMKTALQLERGGWGGGLEAFVPYELLGASQGYLYPAGDPTSHNYGGNLEVAPPVAGFPFGRLLYGGGTEGALLGRSNSDTMNANQVGFLDAQEIQGPALQLSSEWLAVGHIDEIFQFVPDLSPDEGGKSFKVVLASPALARDTLLAAQSRGAGELVVFAGRDGSYSVDEILGAESFMARNEAAQARIDSVQEAMKAGLGLADDDFRPVPVLYEDAGGGLVAAFNPGVQNLVTVGDRVFVPDPEGPVENGSDLWQQATLASLADTDLDVIFVDVYYSYHRLLGEAHCGTNVDRAPYATAWWTESP
jgi:protein-arginine deiminase